jgi:hypothetical protein
VLHILIGGVVLGVAIGAWQVSPWFRQMVLLVTAVTVGMCLYWFCKGLFS